ncbi:MAG: anti-sigma factor antagonist [Lachnospiraceae bacterium]|nr:anti-sigma factor antagonist [Lachnospiraceae bacterium]
MNEEQFKVIEDYLCVKMPREVDHHNAGNLSKKVDEFIYAKKINHVVFDFEGTEFMDSSGIGILAGRYKKVQCFQGKVYVINADKQIRRILLLSGIQKYVVIMKE